MLSSLLLTVLLKKYNTIESLQVTVERWHMAYSRSPCTLTSDLRIIAYNTDIEVVKIIISIYV